jgi:hypothetical protein
MKKYIITEAQLEKLVNKLDEIWPFGGDEVKFSKSPDFKNPNPDPNKSDDDNNKDYAESIKPLSFSEFLKKSEEDAKKDPNAVANDVKSNVAANVSANSAERNLDNAKSSLLKIVGKNYRPIRSYSLKYENSVLGHAEDVALIILTMAYFEDLQKYNDIKINYSANLVFLNAKNLSAILKGDSFIKTNVTQQIDPNDPNKIMLTTDNNTVVVHVTKQNPPVTKKIEFNNIKTTTIDAIITYFNDKNNLKFVNNALSKDIVKIQKSGKQIIVTL